MKPSELINCIIRTDIGAMKVKSAEYSGMRTDPDMNVTKIVKVTCQCGAEFESTMDVLESVAIRPPSTGK